MDNVSEAASDLLGRLSLRSGVEHGVLAGEDGQRRGLLRRPFAQPEGVRRASGADEGGEWTQPERMIAVAGGGVGV